MTVPLRAALYLRVSTARQAEHDVSIPDQRRQGEAYCAARGYELVETYVEPGASATNDRRPEFQRTIEAGTSKPAPFDIVIVHSFCCQRPNPPYRHLLLCRLRRRDDAQDREGWAVSLLHLLDQSPAGRGRLQGPLDPDGEARQPPCRAYRRPIAPAGGSEMAGHDRR
jgi:Resolvase, N terminal domain